MGSKKGQMKNKFTRYGVRSKVYFNKNKRKGKNFLITESLTSRRYKFFRKLMKNKVQINVWTSHGRVLLRKTTESCCTEIKIC